MNFKGKQGTVQRFSLLHSRARLTQNVRNLPSMIIFNDSLTAIVNLNMPPQQVLFNWHVFILTISL
jgi:hypothetical protein